MCRRLIKIRGQFRHFYAFSFGYVSLSREWGFVYLATTPIVAHSAMSGNANKGTQNKDTKTKKKSGRGKKKREATSPALEEGKDVKRINQIGSTSNMESGTCTAAQKIEDALVEVSAKVGECVTTNADTISTLNDHSDIMCSVNKEVQALKEENKRLNKRLDNLEASQKASREKLMEVERTANSNAHLLKNMNLVIEGISENAGEDCRAIAIEILQAIESKCGAEDIISAYRIGHSTDASKFPRPMIVKLIDPMTKLILMENKWRLTNHEKFANIYLNDDLPPAIKKERRTLREIAKFAHQQGYKGCKATGSKLVIEGRVYRYHTLHLLPRALQLCNVKTRLVGDGLGFQGEASFLSNFYPATIRIEENVFSCAEQAYQFFKVRTCKRDDSAMSILEMSNPRDIKIAGDNITTKAVWEQNKEGFMRSIIFSKFMQNDDLRKKLLATGDIPLYECTRNRWWGSGYKLDSPEWATTKCPGLNKMGQITMEVRAALRRRACKTDALLKSPGAIIKSIQMMDKEILKDAGDYAPPDEEPTDMEIGLPVITEENKETDKVEKSGSAPLTSEDHYDGSVSSTVDSDDMMDPTDTEEDSVNITANSSNTSQVSQAARASVTGPDGKLDISKVKNWSLPKIKDIDPSLHDSYASSVSSRTRRQVSTPHPGSSTNLAPQAQSTPHVARMNRSRLMEKIRSNINPVEKK